MNGQDEVMNDADVENDEAWDPSFWEEGVGSGNIPEPVTPGAPTQHQSYKDQRMAQSTLHLHRPRAVEKAYSEHKELGLFTLFMTKAFKATLVYWTNTFLAIDGQEDLKLSEFDAYLGLELAMSITRRNEIGDYWSAKPFLGQKEFPETMSRTRFQTIRSHLRFLPPQEPSAQEKSNDPLWHSRAILGHIQKKFQEIAVPIGVSSLDESSVRTRARTKAKSYMPLKPDKYAVRFYSVVGWSSLYIHSIWDNSSGLSSPLSPAERYVQQFPTLRESLLRLRSDDNLQFDIKAPSTLWIAMAGHQTRMLQSPEGQRRLLVSDNFYTRHALAKSLLAFTDGDIRMLGTVRLNLVDKWNKEAVEAAKVRVNEMNRGSWVLVAAVDPVTGWEKLEKAHDKSQKKKRQEDRVPFTCPVTIAPHSGYVAFKDSKTVLFYTNDLAATPSKIHLASTDEEAVACVHGLLPIARWVGGESMHRTTLNVPAPIAAYNKFMNAVDRVDQLRSTNPTQRKEMRLSMTIFTWALDMCIVNAFALMKHLKRNERVEQSFRDFKLAIITALIEPTRLKREAQRAKRKPTDGNTVDAIGSTLEGHALTENVGKARLTCHLCSMRGLPAKSSTGCTGCLRGFHVNCFAVYHHRHALHPEDTDVSHALRILALDLAGQPAHKTRKRSNNTITPLDKITLPQNRQLSPVGLRSSLREAEQKLGAGLAATSWDAHAHATRHEREKKKREELTLDVEGLRKLLRLKNRELRNLRRLAQTILNQRTDVEQFFLDSLEHVKREIERERKEKHERDVEHYQREVNYAHGIKPSLRFPKLTSPNSPLARNNSTPPGPPQHFTEKVDLRQLSWEDRERVLRLVFAKINRSQSFVVMQGENPHETTETPPIHVRCPNQREKQRSTAVYFATEPQTGRNGHNSADNNPLGEDSLSMSLSGMPIVPRAPARASIGKGR